MTRHHLHLQMQEAELNDGPTVTPFYPSDSSQPIAEHRGTHLVGDQTPLMEFHRVKDSSYRLLLPSPPTFTGYRLCMWSEGSPCRLLLLTLLAFKLYKHFP